MDGLVSKLELGSNRYTKPLVEPNPSLLVPKEGLLQSLVQGILSPSFESNSFITIRLIGYGNDEAENSRVITGENNRIINLS